MRKTTKKRFGRPTGQQGVQRKTKPGVAGVAGVAVVTAVVGTVLDVGLDGVALVTAVVGTVLDVGVVLDVGLGVAADGERRQPGWITGTDVYYDIGKRLKLEGDTENSCICAEKLRSGSAYASVSWSGLGGLQC